jgi:hypothetical protein
LKHTTFAHYTDVVGRRRKKDFSDPLIKLIQGHVSKINIIPRHPPPTKGNLKNKTLKEYCWKQFD